MFKNKSMEQKSIIFKHNFHTHQRLISINVITIPDEIFSVIR